MADTEEPGHRRGRGERPMPPPPRPTRPRIPLPILVPLLIVILVPLGAAWRTILSPDFAGGPNRCAMTYMNPAYFPVPGLNASSNEGNYAVWLYRERGGVGLTPDAAMASVGSGGGSGCGTRVWKTGRSIPGLFVPGNAGSYRQVRSVASETARRVDARRTSHQTSSPSSVPGDTRESAPGNAPVGIDWFALDFNEELSAFHGGLLRRQTAFTSHALAKILETYPPGTPVVIAGHSMGGVVARGALLELGKEGAYGSSALNATLITLATPHADSPAATAPSAARAHRDINDAWIGKRHTRVTSRVAMVSVGGGDADRQVTRVHAKPPTRWLNAKKTKNAKNAKTKNAIHTTAGSIPGASSNVSADHRAIAWCQQVIVPAAETFLDVAAMDDTGDVAARIALAASWLGDESGDESAASTGKILRLVLNRTPSLVPIMLALAIDALVVPQTVRAGGFRVEGSTVREAVALFAAPVFARSRVFLVFALGGFWRSGAVTGALAAFCAYVFASCALALEALALNAIVCTLAKVFKASSGLKGKRPRTARVRRAGDVVEIVDLNFRNGRFAPFAASAFTAVLCCACPSAGVASAVVYRLCDAVRHRIILESNEEDDVFREGAARCTASLLRTLVLAQSASMIAPSLAASVQCAVEGRDVRAMFFPWLKHGVEDALLAMATATPAAFFAFAPVGYVGSERCVSFYFFYMGNSTDVMFFFQQGCDEFPRVARVGELVARDDAGRGPRDADGVRGG
jgi:GPI inositol-deacylase